MLVEKVQIFVEGFKILNFLNLLGLLGTSYDIESEIFNAKNFWQKTKWKKGLTKDL